MSQINVLIEVDVTRLLQEYPLGGNVTNIDIIRMSDGQADSYYENGRPDKLVSMVSPGDIIVWKIQSSQPRKYLEFNQCDTDQVMAQMVNSIPSPVRDRANEYTATVKNNVQSNIASWYNFSFHLNTNPSIVWNWDPMIKSRYL